MTKEEAIKILEVARAECEWNAPLDYQEAFNMAISALQNLPTQMSGTSLNVKVIRSDAIDRFSAGEIDLEDFIKYFKQFINDDTSDLISRQKVIKTINDWYDGRFKNGEEVKTLNRDNLSRDEDGSGFCADGERS